MTMLFFEFFPAFMMLVSLFAGVYLYIADRQARRNEECEPVRQPERRAGRRTV
jgi:preprotein translocase subunit YajC